MENDKILYPSHMDIKSFRNFKDISFDLGRRITVISGQNGVGKSNILSLISSASGLNKKSDLGSNFQPDFNEFFNIDETENYTNYNLFLTYSENSEPVLKKRLSFKNDTRTGRGIRIIPRTAPLHDFESTQDARKIGSELYGVGGDGRVKTPTIYLSLSRLYPLGERREGVDVNKVTKESYFLKNDTCDKYKTWYNAVIPNSIKPDANLTLINKKACYRSSLYMDMTNTPVLSQSIGQDNLGNIISALVDIYNLSLQDDYKGALLCIDEIDVSLHPDTQIRLFNLLVELSEKLNIQLILSTHSLTILKEIIRKEQRFPEKYKLVYLKNPSSPFVTKNKEYSLLKADMFGKFEIDIPKVKIYFEDKVGKKIFDLLLVVFRRLYNVVNNRKTEECFRNYENISYYEKLNNRLIALSEIINIEDNINKIPVILGCETLFHLNDYDDYFKKNIILLDGDARIKKTELKPKIRDYIEKKYNEKGITVRNHYNNICFLPSYFAPESFLYSIIIKLCKNCDKNIDFWRALDVSTETALYTSSKIEMKFSNLKNDFTNDDLKDIFKDSETSELWNFIEKSNMLYYYYSDYENIEELIEFFEDIKKAYVIVHSKIMSENFE